MNQHKLNIIKALKKTSVRPFIKETEDDDKKVGYTASDALNEAYSTFQDIEEPDELLEIAAELYADKVGVDVSEAKEVINDALKNDYFETIYEQQTPDNEDWIDPAGGRHREGEPPNYMQYAKKISNYLSN